MSSRRGVLVVDVGTSGVRAAIVRPDSAVEHTHHVAVLPDSPAPGLVEFDATLMAEAVLMVAHRALDEGGPVGAVGIANQRASTIVWERATGRPVAPGIGWQDLRTVGTCLELQAEGIRLAPNASATKLMSILDAVDADRRRAEAGELCFGTVDSWVAWVLSGGAGAGDDVLHVTDATNAAVTALIDPETLAWSPPILERLRVADRILAAHRRLVRGDRHLPRPAGCPRAVRDRRRPAGVTDRSGLHPPRSGQGHLRDRWHAGPVHRVGATSRS